MADGVLTIKTSVDTGGVKTGVKDIESQVGKLSSVINKLGKVMIAVGAIKVFSGFAKECTELGSALSEVENVTNTVFPNMKEQVDEFTQSAAKTAGLSETMAKQFAGTFGSMAKAMGFSENASFEMSKSLTQLSGDVASFYNIDQEEAFNKLKAVFTGETEGLKSLGVVMTQTALDQFALNEGLGKTVSQMTEAEKVSLRYQFVMQKLSSASGDFEKTSDGWANSLRTFNLQVQQIKTNIGQGLINAFLPVLKVINRVLEALNTLAIGFKKVTELIFGASENSTVTPIQQIDYSDLGSSYDDAADSAQDYSDAQSDAAKNTKKAANAAKALISPLDHINRIQKENSTDSSSGKSSKNKTSANTATNALNSLSNVDFGSVDTTETKLDSIAEKAKNLYESCKRYLEPATKAFERFKNALKPITEKIASGLRWILDNVLKPLAKFTITEVVPRFFDTLSAALNVINPILTALQPLWQWFWNNILQPIATYTAGVFLDVWDKLIELLNKFGTWCSENPEKIRTITTVIVAFIAAFKFTKIISGIATFITKFGDIGTVIQKVGGLITTAFSNPWVIAIGAVIAAILLIATNWDKVKETVSKIWKSLKDSATTVFNAIKTTVNVAWTAIKETCSDVWNGVTEYLSNAWDGIKSTASTVWGTIKKSITDTWDSIKSTASTVWNEVSSAVVSSWDTVKSTASATWNGIVNAVTTTWGSMKDTAKSIFSTATDSIDKIIGKCWEGIKSAAQKMWNGAGNIGAMLTKAWGAIKNTSATLFTKVKDNIANAWEGAKDKAKEVWEGTGGIEGIIKKVLDGISSTATTIGTNIKDSFKTAFQDVMDVIKSPINGIIGMLNSLISGFVSKLNFMIEALNKFSIKVPSWVPVIGNSRYGFNIPKIETVPQIPYLAKGAVIPPNSPFTAVLGDQKSGNNIETPESLLREIVKSESGSGTYRFTAQINRRVLFDEIITEAKLRRTQNGRNPFEMAF